jgi:hypothetical protein
VASADTFAISVLNHTYRLPTNKILSFVSCHSILFAPRMVAPPSQVPSRALDPGWITIALEKFSFAVSPVGAGSHQWVHDTRRDELFLVFRSVRPPQGGDKFESRLIMSVSVGSENLVRATLLRSFERKH